MLRVKLGIIGCGNMGEAIIKGAVANKVIHRKNIYVSDKKKIKATNLRKKYGVIPQGLNSNLVRKSDIIILAVKPQDSTALLEDIRYFLDGKKMLISIMAGVNIAKIAKVLGKTLPIARVMPNMAAFVGESMSAVSYNDKVTKDYRETVLALFKGIGSVSEIDENLQDAFTALVGSGPAYFFYFVESFVSAARKLGFTHKEAMKFVIQTVKGSAKVLVMSDVSPRILRERVTSKRGTTEAAIRLLEQKGVKRTVTEAVLAAAKRSKDMAR